MEQTITGFEAKYDRFGYIKLSDDYVCDKCGLPGVCIVIDSSMDEYGPGKICIECVEESLERYYDGSSK